MKAYTIRRMRTYTAWGREGGRTCPIWGVTQREVDDFVRAVRKGIPDVTELELTRLVIADLLLNAHEARQAVRATLSRGAYRYAVVARGSEDFVLPGDFDRLYTYDNRPEAEGRALAETIRRNERTGEAYFVLAYREGLTPGE